jgi:hypothetical protein
MSFDRGAAAAGAKLPLRSVPPPRVSGEHHVDDRPCPLMGATEGWFLSWERGVWTCRSATT